MQAPTLCMIFEAIGSQSAIAKVSMTGVKVALEADWKVTVIAKYLDESLRDQVEWLKLYAPPRLFFVQWMSARMFIKAALGARKFDVVHGHQPQIASLCDVFQCHFLTRVAYERKCLEERCGLRARFVRLQQQGVLYAEDYYYRRWNPQTVMLYDSALTRREFHRLYEPCPREDVLVYDFPPLRLATEQDRAEARRRWVGEDQRSLVVGYLGGLQERKGYRRLLDAVRRSPDLFLLMGGQYTEGFVAPGLEGRMKSVGTVNDTASFYAACDVFVVPSLFEPLGLVAFEAAARGTPVIATDEVGALPHLLEFGAGMRWAPAESLGSVVREAVRKRATLVEGVGRMADALSIEKYGSKLLSTYDEVLARADHRPAAMVTA